VAEALAAIARKITHPTRIRYPVFMILNYRGGIRPIVI